MKKNIIITIILVVLAIIISSTTTYIIVNNKQENSKKTECLNEKTGIFNIKKIKYTLPEFVIPMFGKYDSVISNETINDLPIYQFDAIFADGECNQKNTYIGIKWTDITNKLNISDYNYALFMSDGGLQINYDIKEITNNLFLVFEQNGHSFNGEVDILSGDYLMKYNISNVLRIDIN